MKQKYTIEELERFINSDEQSGLEILPNGEIRVTDQVVDLGSRKPLTLRENIGGEY